MRNLRFLLPLLLIFISPLWPQSETGKENDPSSYIGLNLTELIRLFGPPRSVHTARGQESWQDDVVFSYGNYDFFIYKDRVWQISFKTVLGMKVGDSRSDVSALLNSATGPSKPESYGDSIFYSLSGRSWPLMLRCDFDKADKVQAIFIYRMDL